MKERWTAVLENLRRHVGVGGEDGIRVGWALRGIRGWTTLSLPYLTLPLGLAVGQEGKVL